MVVITLMIFLLWRRNEKKKDRKLAEISSTMPGLMPGPAPGSPNVAIAFQQVKRGTSQQESYSSLGRYSELAQNRNPPEPLETRGWMELPENQQSGGHGVSYELYAEARVD